MKKILIYGVITLLIFGVSISCKKTQVDEPEQYDNATNFVAKDINGRDFSLDSFKGKVIMVVFSAYWCGPCRTEAAELEAFYNQYKNQGLEIVQVLIEDEDGNTADLSDIKRWAQDYGINFTLLYDEDESSSSDYSISSLPTNIIIDRDFKIRNILKGFSSIRSLASIIEKLL